MKLSRSIAFHLLFLALVSGPVAAQDDLERVRSLYASAAYEEALAAMPPAADAPVRTDVEQYRALCLLALGRSEEAVTAVERLVREQPTFVPPVGDTSPRLQTIFAEVRSRLLPELARRMYLASRAEYEARNHSVADAGFRRTLDLIESLPEGDKSGVADLRLLSTEFLALVTERLDAGPAPAAAPPTRAAPLVVEYVPPVPVSETLPPWLPPDSASARIEYVGLLRLRIGADGRVESATIIKSSHPAYDTAAVRAARSWTYTAAQRNGRSVSAQKDIQIRLLPR
jgi:TonB family protein